MPKKTNKKSSVRKSKRGTFPIVRAKSRTIRKASRFTPFTRRIASFFGKFLKSSSLRTKTLLALGTILIVIPTFFYINEGVQLAFFTPKVPIVQKQYAPPTWITIKAVDMELPITETAIANGSWGIAENAISHLNISGRPGENGPIILYGHNTNDRFGPIRWLTAGKTIELLTSDGKHHVYEIKKTVDVNPDQVSVLLTQKGETLILYTCDGFADLKRFVVIAKPAVVVSSQ